MSDKNITTKLVLDPIQPEPCILLDGTKFGRANVHLEITTNDGVITTNNGEKIQLSENTKKFDHEKSHILMRNMQLFEDEYGFIHFPFHGGFIN